MSGIRDRLVSVGGYVVEPLRSVRRGIALALSGLDSDDLEAVAGVLVYLTLGTLVVAWASSMYLLVRAITGV